MFNAVLTIALNAGGAGLVNQPSITRSQLFNRQGVNLIRNFPSIIPRRKDTTVLSVTVLSHIGRKSVSMPVLITQTIALKILLPRQRQIFIVVDKYQG